MNLYLADEETAALLRELNHIIDGDRYPFSSRIRTLTAIRDKLRPPPVRELSIRHHCPPSDGHGDSETHKPKMPHRNRLLLRGMRN